jgi:hypothetical protein
MKEKATELSLERQMADLERSIPQTTKHERRMIRAALDIFSGTLEFVPPDPKNTTHEQREFNTGLFDQLKGMERII